MRLRKTLDYEGLRRVLAGWSGYAGLVYFHLLLDRLEEARDLSEKGSEAQDSSGYRKHADTEA